MRKCLALLFALLIAATSTQAAFAADAVFIMRHLQKADGADPPLSAVGTANAQALANMLARSGIKAIFATPTRRAMQTAQPLAQKLGLNITSYDAKDPQILAREVAAIPGAVLIVGHSDTVPDLVARFGGKQPVAISEQDYGTVFVVANDGKVSQLKLPSTPESCGPSCGVKRR